MSKRHTDPSRPATEEGVIYTLHFSRPYRHARHYTGWTKSPESFEARLECHKSGRGNKLVFLAHKAGIALTVVRMQPGTRDDETRIKARGGASRWCPLCRSHHAEAADD